jgi:hypothetical protein
VKAVAEPFPLKYWLVGVASFCDGGGPKYAINLRPLLLECQPLLVFGFLRSGGWLGQGVRTFQYHQWWF